MQKYDSQRRTVRYIRAVKRIPDKSKSIEIKTLIDYP